MRCWSYQGWVVVGDGAGAFVGVGMGVEAGIGGFSKCNSS